ncbi:hypothetical protein LC593_33410 [Nostoc sp. CHAB 5844]|nr:hypothetical protein [Nostoc sp. CHAB 5844]
MDSRITTLAKQGDANAIAVLLNNSLNEKRIIAKVAKKVQEAQQDLDNAFRKNLGGERISKYSYVLSHKEGVRDGKCGN